MIALVFGLAIDFVIPLDPHAAAARLWLESNPSVKEQVGRSRAHSSFRSVTSALKRDAEESIVSTSSWCEVPKGTPRSLMHTEVFRGALNAEVVSDRYGVALDRLPQHPSSPSPTASHARTWRTAGAAFRSRLSQRMTC